ncbi:MAG TPA: MBL fold metallo-hydrolase [Virgibacillus sp.]|nr:MBL fold metallo-hydrolase [Virgibacillus sp.]
MTVYTHSIQQLTVPTPFSVGDVHAYLLKGETLSLIDAGIKTSEAWRALKTQLKACGYLPRDIEQIILTHHHPDHTGLIDQFPRVKTIAAHPEVNIWLKKDKAFLQRYEHFFKTAFTHWGVPEHYVSSLDKQRLSLQYAGNGEVTDIIQEGDCLPGHPDFHVFETKGHAQTHLSFLRKDDGAFFAGDHLLPHIASNPLMEAPYNPKDNRPKPLLQYRRNLRKCLNLPIQTVYPGHGAIFSDFHTLIAKRLKKQENQANKLLTFMVHMPQTPFQLCMQLYPHRYTELLDLTMSQTVSLLDFLHENHFVDRTIKNDIVYFQAL